MHKLFCNTWNNFINILLIERVRHKRLHIVSEILNLKNYGDKKQINSYLVLGRMGRINCQRIEWNCPML